jgi:uncharacterized membrane protein
MSKKALVKAAVASVITAGLALSTQSALAKDMEMEKCYGVAKAGQNDCGGKAAGHACQGQGKVSRDPNEWLLVPKGTCDKLAGGALQPATKTSMNDAQNPSKKDQNS